MKKEKTTEEILAQIEIDKINARSTAKEIASKHLGKHAINYITVLVVIGVISSTHLEGGALTAVIGLVSTAAMAMIGILQHIVGAKEKERDDVFSHEDRVPAQLLSDENEIEER